MCRIFIIMQSATSLKLKVRQKSVSLDEECEHGWYLLILTPDYLPTYLLPR